MTTYTATDRPLKFRVWDGRDMHYFHDLTEWDVKDYSEFSRLIHKGCRVMQFTGLMDKAGEEIYEGDVCNVTRYNRNAFVIWDGARGEFAFKLYNDARSSRWGEAFYEDMLVIGHIYDGRKG